MLKSIHKKKLSLLFVVVALTWYGQMSSMKKEIISSNPCKLPTIGTTIEYLPHHCLGEILQFCADVGGEKTSELRCVSKQFKDVIENNIENECYPCYLAYINKKPYFLHYRISCDWVHLHNEKSVKRFVDEPFIDNYSKNTIPLAIKLSLDEKKRAEFLRPLLKRLMLRLSKKRNSLKIKYYNVPGFIFVRYGKKSHQLDNLFFYDNNLIFNEGLMNMFENIKSLHIENNFSKRSKIKFPKKIQEMYLWKCGNFDFTWLKDLGCLQKLTLVELNEFKGSKFKKLGLNSLEELSISFCKELNPTGLEKLKKLKTLHLAYIKDVKNYPLKSFGNIQELSLNYSYSEMKKTDKIFETTVKFKNLQKLFLCLYGRQNFRGKQWEIRSKKLFEKVEALTKKGCTVYSHLA